MNRNLAISRTNRSVADDLAAVQMLAGQLPEATLGSLTNAQLASALQTLASLKAYAEAAEASIQRAQQARA